MLEEPQSLFVEPGAVDASKSEANDADGWTNGNKIRQIPETPTRTTQISELFEDLRQAIVTSNRNRDDLSPGIISELEDVNNGKKVTIPSFENFHHDPNIYSTNERRSWDMNHEYGTQNVAHDRHDSRSPLDTQRARITKGIDQAPSDSVQDVHDVQINLDDMFNNSLTTEYPQGLKRFSLSQLATKILEV